MCLYIRVLDDSFHSCSPPVHITVPDTGVDVADYRCNEFHPILAIKLQKVTYPALTFYQLTFL